MTLILALFSFAKVCVSSILDSPLGKAAVKTASITNSDEESVAADKGFSSKDKRGERRGEVGGAGLKREICFLDPIMI